MQYVRLSSLVQALTPDPWSWKTPAPASSHWTIVLVLRCAASKLQLLLRGPGGLPHRRRCGGLSLPSLLELPPSMSSLSVASKLCFRLRGPKGLPCRLHCDGLSLRSPSLCARCGDLSLCVQTRSLRESSCESISRSVLPVCTRRQDAVSIFRSFVDELRLAGLMVAGGFILQPGRLSCS